MSGFITNGNINSNSGQFGIAVIDTLSSTTTLWTAYVNKPHRYIFTLSGNQTVILPEIRSSSSFDIAKAAIGHSLFIANKDSGSDELTIEDSNNATISTLSAQNSALFVAENDSPQTWKVINYAGSGIEDVNVTNPMNNQILVYNSSPGEWNNENPGTLTLAAGSGISLSSPETYNPVTGDQTITITSTAATPDLNTVYQVGGNTVDINSGDGPIILRDDSSPQIGSIFIIDDGTERYLDINNSYLSALKAATPTGSNGIVIGASADIGSADNAIALGTGSGATGDSSIAIGTNCQSSGNNAICIGPNSSAEFSDSICIGSGSSLNAAYQISIGRNNTVNGNNSGIISPTSSTINISGAGHFILSCVDSELSNADAGYFDKFFTAGERWFTNIASTDPDYTRANRTTWGANEVKTTSGNVTNDQFTSTLNLPDCYSVIMRIMLIGTQTNCVLDPAPVWSYTYHAHAVNSGSPPSITISSQTNRTAIEDGTSLNNSNPLVFSSTGNTLQFGLTTTGLEDSPADEIQWILIVEAAFNNFA